MTTKARIGHDWTNIAIKAQRLPNQPWDREENQEMSHGSSILNSGIDRVTLPKRKINAAVDDLMFGVRIGDAAKRADADISFAHWPPDGAPPDLLIVDLNLKSARPLDLIGERKGQTRIVAFGSHVDVETLRAAQAAGADKVLPRSAFVRQLDEILRQG